jgi:thiol-disulfide isomerase/thioredoxin
VALEKYTGRPLLVAFICNHCPYVTHLQSAFAALGNKLIGKGVGVVAISANDVENYPQDGPEKMAETARHFSYDFPYLYDESQTVAHRYGAVCTPDFYLFDAGHSLVYHGQFDASRPNSDVPVTGADLRTATETVLAGGTPETEQKPSVGCSIKWKPGNEPAAI